MARLLTLLLMFALAVTNGAAVAAAMCQHEDGFAHAAALQSSDEVVSHGALNEEAAAATVSKKASFSDAAASVAAYILPADPLAFATQGLNAASRPAADPPGLTGRSTRPLLEPPLS